MSSATSCHRPAALAILAASLSLAPAAAQAPTDELRRLREQIAFQQQQIEALQAALASQSEALTQLERALTAAGPAPASEPVLATAEALPRRGGLSLKAGGFVEATAVYRTRNQNADVGETFGNIALDGTANAALSEFRMSSRHSRLSLLARADGQRTRATGYFEGDFLASAPTANEVESNDFPIRIRQFWGDLAFDNGLSFTAGQTWTLLTTHQRGLRPLDEYLTLALSAQHVVGFNWARQTAFRVTKDFGRGVWAAAAVENPETHTGGVVLPDGAQGFSGSPNARTPAATFVTSQTPGSNGLSTDLAPDVVGKLVFEPGWGHYEIKGVGRWFRGRLDGQNHTAFGGGVGGAAILPLTKKLDLLAEGLAGPGIGRYAAAVGPDVAFGPAGEVRPIRGAQGIFGLDWRPTRRWQIYNYVGAEYYARTSFPAATAGFGSPLLDLGPCVSENGGPCPGGNRSIWQAMPGVWYDVHRGEQGAVSLGASYIHTRRALWSGVDGLRPRGAGNSFMASIRYYLP